MMSVIIIIIIASKMSMSREEWSPFCRLSRGRCGYRIRGRPAASLRRINCYMSLDRTEWGRLRFRVVSILRLRMVSLSSSFSPYFLFLFSSFGLRFAIFPTFCLLYDVLLTDSLSFSGLRKKKVKGTKKDEGEAHFGRRRRAGAIRAHAEKACTRNHHIARHRKVSLETLISTSQPSANTTIASESRPHFLLGLRTVANETFSPSLAMYTRTDDPIRLFELPNTLIGDFAVTTIMQTIITWMIEMIVVNRDLRKASVRPIGFVDEPQLQDPSSPSSPLSSISRRLPRCAIRGIRWFMLLDQPKTQRKRRGSFTRKLRYVFAQILRALLVGVFLGALLIGPTVGILIALGVKEGGDWVYASRWTPEIFKLILGGVLALLTSPFFAMYWMIKCGWNGGIHESVMINGNETK